MRTPFGLIGALAMLGGNVLPSSGLTVPQKQPLRRTPLPATKATRQTMRRHLSQRALHSVNTLNLRWNGETQVGLPRRERRALARAYAAADFAAWRNKP